MKARTRREFVVGAGAVVAPLLVGCAGHKLMRAGGAAGIDTIVGAGSLKAHAYAKGCWYGCAVDTLLLASDAAYARLVREQAGMVVAENAMKWEALRPSVDRYDFEAADGLVAFAEANGQKVRGHTLCWQKQLPGWFAGMATNENARGLLTSHIETVAGRYAGRMHSWDVVNEAVEVKDGRPDGLRDSVWLRLVGEDYLEVAFRAAREADPQALLAYNEYGLEGEDRASLDKRIAVLVLLRRLKARHVPIDALGLQSHLTAGHRFGTGLNAFLIAVRELGLQVFITEMDVNDRLQAPGEPARDDAVARTYGQYLDLVLREPAVRVVMTWGITDRKTWLNGEAGRADKLPERCLPFDAKDAPVRAFFAMRKAFDERTAAASKAAL